MPIFCFGGFRSAERGEAFAPSSGRGDTAGARLAEASGEAQVSPRSFIKKIVSALFLFYHFDCCKQAKTARHVGV